MGEVPADGVVKVPEQWGGKNIIAIDETAFKYVDGVKKIIMPNTVVDIEEKALKKIESEYFSVSDKDNGKDKDNVKDNNGNLWIYIIIGAVVVIAGAIAFVLLKKKTADKIKEN